MIGNRHKAALLAAAGLVVAGLTVVTTNAPATAASFTERWCSSGSPAPCITSATLNGSDLHKGDAVKIAMIPTVSTTDFNYTELDLEGDTSGITTSDTFVVNINLGTLRPDYTEGFAGRPDVDRKNLGGGQYAVTYIGHPVLVTHGCTNDYPVSCPTTSGPETPETLMFQAEIHQLKTDKSFTGFDRSQSADKVDGIFLNSTPSGDYLESTWNNSRYLDDGTTLVHAEARFRIPYRMLVSDFNIPDPSTMVATSLVGTVNGAPATYAFSQDPHGGAVFVDISGVTFPPGTARLAQPGKIATKPRVIRVKRGTITPTAPGLTKATRVTGAKARLVFARAKARGAKVTGYQARCQSPGHPTKTASGSYPAVVVKHLKPGRHYTCSVRATSKRGPGRWSVKLKV